MILKVKNISNIGGIVKAPPSKSYSHRAIILASLARGTSRLYDVLLSEDTFASINVCKALGAKITQYENYNRLAASSSAFCAPGQGRSAQ